MHETDHDDPTVAEADVSEGDSGAHATGRRVTKSELASMVREINVLARRFHGLDLALRIGRLYASWKTAGLRASLRRLGGHPDALVKRSRLTAYVNVELQSRLLEPRMIDELGLSMHVALLPVPSVERKLELAAWAVADEWTLEELNAAVAESSGKSVHRRRIALLAEKAAATAATLHRSRVSDSLDGFDVEEGERLAAELEAAATAIVDRLRGRTKAAVGKRDSDSFSPV